MFDLRLPFCIPSSLILALAGTILSGLVHFSNAPLSRQHHPAGILSSFHSWKNLYEIWTVSPFCWKWLQVFLDSTLEIRGADYLILVYFFRFKFILPSSCSPRFPTLSFCMKLRVRSLCLKHPFLLFLSIGLSGPSFILIFSINDSFLGVSLPAPRQSWVPHQSVFRTPSWCHLSSVE